MKAFPINSIAMPVIYLDEKNQKVFVLLIDRQEGVEVHQADAPEIRALAMRYGLPDLLIAATPESEKAEAAARRVKMHTLIVEDDAMSRHALHTLLRRSGYDIDCAATMSEAEAKLDQRPRCLILDLNLPDGDGTALLKRIRAANLPIKVAVTTATTDPAQYDAMCECSPDAVFRKPLNLTDVMHWLDSAA